MTPLIAFAVFVAVALLGWGFIELRNHSFHFNHSKDEQHGWDEMKEAYEENGEKELNLHDLLARNSTKGYKAV